VDDKLAKQEKRMLKNRESAARSRLRRQQFTEGLERENANLKVGGHRAIWLTNCTMNEVSCTCHEHFTVAWLSF
jgi:hypothetical protein